MTYANAIRARLRADLKTAMVERRREDLALIRTLIAAIDNAEAVALPNGAKPADSAAFASGGAEAQRRLLSGADVAKILKVEIATRLTAAAQIRIGGNADQADQLEAEAQQIVVYLG